MFNLLLSTYYKDTRIRESLLTFTTGTPALLIFSVVPYRYKQKLKNAGNKHLNTCATCYPTASGF
ncbi:MAG: hypothetical protein CMC70_09445 [Flavobacteriaceae bacterium]|nr:hypothetical protein [Flavobacteriaceae bacterium]